MTSNPISENKPKSAHTFSFTQSVYAIHTYYKLIKINFIQLVYI